MKKSYLTVFGIGLALLASALVSIYLFAVYSLEHHSNIQKDSLAYFLLLDAEIAHIPMAQTSDDVIFKHFAQDGTAPAMDVVSVNVLDIKTAATETENYFIKQGYTWQTVCERRCTKILTKDDITLSIYPDNNRLEVIKIRNL
jgi:hypothetical protein